MAQMKPEWAKSYLCRPRDYLQSHIHIHDKARFRASFEKDPCQAPMSFLIGWEYGRIWCIERDEYIKQRKIKSQPKRIKNDYRKWLDKRCPKVNKHCPDRTKVTTFKAKSPNQKTSVTK